MSYWADILIRSSDGDPVGIAEVKNPEKLSREGAIQLKRDLLAHGRIPRISYFLLVSQDAGYLWSADSVRRPLSPPTIEFPMSQVVAHYFPALRPGERLREAELELIVRQWLRDLTDREGKALMEVEKLLASSGFRDAIRGATVMSAVAV